MSGTIPDTAADMDRLLTNICVQTAEKRAWNIADVLEGRAPFESWRKGLLDALRTSLVLPAALKDREICLSHWEQAADCRRRRFTYLAEDGLPTPGYILEPEHLDANAPAVICLHGHGYGCRDIVGLRQEASYQKKYALTVASAGMIAVAPELAGFGELRLREDLDSGNGGQSSCHRLAMGLLACGRTLLGMRVNQVIAAVDAVTQLYPGRPVGIMGISGGGTVALLTMALEPRLTACVISGYANTFRDSILAMHHCVDNYWPGMAGQMEMPDLLSCVAPRPMLWETGSRDPIYPQAAALKSAEVVAAVYRLLHAPDLFTVDAFEGIHEVHGTKAIGFLKSHCA